MHNNKLSIKLKLSNKWNFFVPIKIEYKIEYLK